jgi:hypothetical protein
MPDYSHALAEDVTTISEHSSDEVKIERLLLGACSHLPLI